MYRQGGSSFHPGVLASGFHSPSSAQKSQQQTLTSSSARRLAVRAQHTPSCGMCRHVGRGHSPSIQHRALCGRGVAMSRWRGILGICQAAVPLDASHWLCWICFWSSSYGSFKVVGKQSDTKHSAVHESSITEVSLSRACRAFVAYNLASLQLSMVGILKSCV